MAHFLLIHGASHGAWCWAKIEHLLQAKGHEVSAIDLPGHGADETPRADVQLADYVARVQEYIRPDTILLGHSFGGFPITLAASEAPKGPRALVYLCALLPRPNQAFTDFRAEAISPEVSAAQTVDRPAGVTHVVPEKAGPIFYSDCSAEDQSWALARLTPQPIAVMTEVMEFIPPEIERHYIRCTNDRVIFPDYQRRVSAGWSHIHEMATGHSPFLSDPQGLADILDGIAYP
ncbi:MAG: alpha/beta fold hydrolase [Pseudomonadota bacterium]